MRRHVTKRYGHRNKGKFIQQLISYMDMKTTPPQVKEFIKKRMMNEKGEISPYKVAKLSREEIYKNFPFPAFLSKDYGKSVLIIRKLDDLSKKLDKKFGNKFVCIQLIGSRVKGYAESKSDMEYQIITRKANRKEQKKMCDQLAEEMDIIGMDVQDIGNPDITGQRAVWKGTFAHNIQDFEEWARHRGLNTAIGDLFEKMNIGDPKKIFNAKKQVLKYIEEGPKPVPKGEFDLWTMGHPKGAGRLSAKDYWNYRIIGKKGSYDDALMDKRPIKGIDVKKLSKERRKLFLLPDWETMKKIYLKKK